jgi:VWFA-related protein
MHSKQLFSALTVIIVALTFSQVPEAYSQAQREDSLNVRIAALDKVGFPEIHLFVQVTDSAGAPITELSDSNFEVFENGVPVVFDITTAEFNNACYGMALDCSGSMGGYEGEVIFACTTFVTGKLAQEQAAVIFFEDFSDTRIVQPMTNDYDLLLDAVLQYYANGMTAQWYGYYLALEECRFEPHPRVMIGFTDGQDNSSQSYTLHTVATLANLIGAPVYTIGLGSVNPDPLIQVANATGGSYIYTTPDSLWLYYQQIQRAYQNQYEVAYVSPDPTPNGSSRTIEVQVSYLSLSNTDSSQYNAPWVSNFAPVITLTPYTQDSLLTVSQQTGVPVTVQAWITDNDFLTATLVRYRSMGEIRFYHRVMNHVADSLYEYTFEASDMQPPGIEFYVQAADNYYHITTSPESNQTIYPHQIAVLPNETPEITHIPVVTWDNQTEMPITCDVTDNTLNVDQVLLYFQNTGEIFWSEIPMHYTGGDTWEASIPASALFSSLDLKYFIRAIDNWESYNIHGTHFVDVTTLPIQVTLVPFISSIQIPISGGSFEFYIFVANEGSVAETIDLWSEVKIPPDYTTFGPLMGPYSIELAPGTLGWYRVQEVPFSAPPGAYTYLGHAGIYSTTIWNSDSIEFVKLETGRGSWVGDWLNWGDSIGNEGVSLPVAQPREFALYQATPNPFNNITGISFAVPDAGRITLIIYDVNGRRVETLVDGWREAGIHDVTFDASELASGVYLYRLKAGSHIATKKMILIK